MTLQEIQSNKSFEEFKNNLIPKRTKGKYNTGITTLDVFKIYKSKYRETKYYVHKDIYYKIISSVNKELVELLYLGFTINFPKNMGSFYITKVPIFKRLKKGLLRTNANLNWHTTLKLWYEDEDAFKDKIILRNRSNEKYVFVYKRSKSQVRNKNFFSFIPSRNLKRNFFIGIEQGKYKIDFYEKIY